MDQSVQTQIEILSRTASLDIGDARALPMSMYDDPALFEAELEAIFHKSWICVGRLEQVEKPGDWFTVEIAGEPVVVVRGMDGTLRALSSVCSHRYVTVADGRSQLTVESTDEQFTFA